MKPAGLKSPAVRATRPHVGVGADLGVMTIQASKPAELPPAGDGRRDDACGRMAGGGSRSQQVRALPLPEKPDDPAYQHPFWPRSGRPGTLVTAWHIRPHSKPRYDPERICTNDPTHTWSAPLTSRANGSDCPECRQVDRQIRGRTRPLRLGQEGVRPNRIWCRLLRCVQFTRHRPGLSTSPCLCPVIRRWSQIEEPSHAPAGPRRAAPRRDSELF